MKEASSGSLDELTATLNQRSSSGPTQNTHGNSSSPSNTVTRPSNAYSHFPRQVEWSQPSADDNNSPSPESALRSPPSQNQLKMYLELCITSGKFAQILGEVDVKDGESDGTLFRKIRETYEGTRKCVLPVRYSLKRPVAAIFVQVSLSVLATGVS